jgi:hypothetical protein
MLKDMDSMEARFLSYVEVSTFNQFEQSKIFMLTLTKVGIVMLTIQHDSIFSVCLMLDPWDDLRQTSPAVLSVEEFPIYI